MDHDQRPDRGVAGLPTWPLSALLVFVPVWWALGLVRLLPILVAAVMTLLLLRRRVIALPPGFVIWLVFLAWVCASAVGLGATAPGTIAGSFAARLPGFGLRLTDYVAATVIMLYVGNLSEQDLPQRRLIRMLGILFMTTVAGGLAAILFPTLRLPSLVTPLLPESVRSHPYVERLFTPQLAQVQELLGSTSARPSAPFAYTNWWGHAFALLLPWFVVGWWALGSKPRRVAMVAVLGIAVVPVIESLNRGLWLGLVVAAAVVVVGLVRMRRRRAVIVLAAAAVVGGAALVGSPLGGVIVERIANPHSNEARIHTALLAATAAGHSPVLGYGSTRSSEGGSGSAARGASPACPRCGGPLVGTDGQLWILLISQGIAGAGLYIGFIVIALRACARDHTPSGVAATVVLVLALVYLPIYTAVGFPLVLYLISYAAVWRRWVMVG